MKLSWTLMFVAAGLFSLPLGVSAGITLSKSNRLPEEVNAQIVTMLGQELSALRRLPEDHLNTLASSAPKREKRRWFFGRRNDDVSGSFKHSVATLSRLPTAKGGSSLTCLSEALYFEARGESVMGQFAVAEVILNRVDSGSFPSSVCGVVNQGASYGLHQCQFSYKCDGKAEVISERAIYNQVTKIAKIMIDGEPRILTKGATYYHTTAVSPSWARKFTKTNKIGVHLFYRDNRQFSSN